MIKKITSVFAAVMLICTVAFTSIGAAAEPSASFEVDALSKYVFRGMEMSKEGVVQTDINAGYGDLTVGVWGNLDPNNEWENVLDFNSEDWTLNEVRFNASFIHDFEKVKAGIGYVHYSYDVARPFAADTSEVYGLVGLNGLLSPTLTAYKDIDALETWYFNLGVSHAFEVVGDATLDLAASAGYIVDNNDAFGYDGFNEGLVTAELNIPFGTYFSFVPMVGYSFPLTSDAADFIEAASTDGESKFFFGGASLVYAF